MKREPPIDRLNRSKPRWGAYLIGAYLFSVPAFGHSESSLLLAIPQAAGALLVAYALFDVLGSFRIKVPAEVGLYGLMGLWAGVTFFLLPGTTPEDLQSLGTLLKVVLTTLACAQLIKDEDDLSIALNIFVFSAIFVYYLNSAELQQLTSIGSITEQDRFAGTLANANAAAMFSLAVLWSVLFLLVRSRFAALKIALYLPPVGAALLIVYYTGSKKGLVGLALLAMFISRLLYLRQGAGAWRKGLVIGLSIMLILVVGYFIYTSPFFFRLGQVLEGVSNISDENRLSLVAESIRVWTTDLRTFIMGVGYDQFWKYSTLGDYAHSTPLELLASNGIVGLSLFMGFLALLWRRFWRLYRQTSDHDLKSGSFAVLVFLFIYGFFMIAAVLHDAREMLPILSCLAALGQSYTRPPEPGRSDGLAHV
jgi:O-antigen ligase